MADSKGTTALQSIKNVCGELNDDTSKMKHQVDSWLEGSRKALEDLTVSHKNTMQKLDETNADYLKKYKALKAESAKIQKEEEKQRQELQLIEMRITQLREKENVVPQQLEATRKVLQRNLQAISSLRQQIDESNRARKEKQAELTKGSQYYSTHLGLTFERFEGKGNHLRFVFTQIDPKDPARTFHFTIKVNEDEYYQLLECQPSIKAMPDLVKQLNKSNDLTSFVRAARREFRALVL